MVQIIPSILATSEDQYKNDLSKLESAQSLEDGWVHIDFADNKFVQTQTVGVETAEKFPTNFKKEAHLMVVHPSHPWISELEKLNFSRIIVHLESDTQDWITDNLRYLEDKNIEVGLAINPDTELDKVSPFINDIDVLQIMGINPGLQGQQFIPETINKVKKAVQLFKGQYGPKISVDGGVKDTNAKLLMDAGADILVVGSYLLKGDVDENLENLWEIING